MQDPRSWSRNPWCDHLLLCLGICSIESRKKEFTDRRTDRQSSVQFSTLRGLIVVHTAVRCSLSALPLRNAKFHLTETSVSAHTNIPILTAGTIQRGLPPEPTHSLTQNSQCTYSVTMSSVRAAIVTVEKQ
jgi:hypothetical protein